MHNPDSPLADSEHTWKIQPQEAGQRLDRYLVGVLQDLSRTAIQQLVIDGKVLVNGRPGKPGHMLRSGDEVRALKTTPESRQGSIRPSKAPLDIVRSEERRVGKECRSR